MKPKNPENSCVCVWLLYKMALKFGWYAKMYLLFSLLVKVYKVLCVYIHGNVTIKNNWNIVFETTKATKASDYYNSTTGKKKTIGGNNERSNAWISKYFLQNLNICAVTVRLLLLQKCHGINVYICFLPYMSAWYFQTQKCLNRCVCMCGYRSLIPIENLLMKKMLHMYRITFVG